MSLSRIAIDEHGNIFYGDEKIKSPEDIEDVYTHLNLNTDFTYTSQFEGRDCLVEAFDAPIVAHQVVSVENKIFLKNIIGLEYAIQLDSVRVDEWDRFYGLCKRDNNQNILPFILNESAQNDFFDCVDSFDDDSFVFHSQTYPVTPLYEERDDIKSQNFWSDIYKQPEVPGWDLQQPSPIFKDMLPRLKLHKSKVIVLGCGEGHDAALFAELGHIVTAVDFSEAALIKAKQKYPHPNIQWIHSDVFKLGHEHNHQYDLVVEHTCYCAIPPINRKELSEVWSRLLHSQGQLMAIFYVMPKYVGPPFGTTEWEVRKRLEKKFQFLFWNRSALSVPRRLGKELFVFGQKR